MARLGFFLKGFFALLINQAHQQVTNRAARQGQIEAQRFEGGVHSKTMDDDGESICRSRSKLVVTCLCAWLITFFSMHIFFAQILTILLPYGTGDALSPIECESRSFETAFDTNVHVEASMSYPRVPETSLLARYVNEAVRKESHELYDIFVQEMGALQEELWEEDADERTLRYGLDLVYVGITVLS